MPDQSIAELMAALVVLSPRLGQYCQELERERETQRERDREREREAEGQRGTETQPEPAHKWAQALFGDDSEGEGVLKQVHALQFGVSAYVGRAVQEITQTTIWNVKFYTQFFHTQFFGRICSIENPPHCR